MKTISDIKKPHYVFSDNIEEIAINQFRSAMEQDFSIQGALMPDAHMGYSLPIGGVVKTEGIIVPSWVGVDIGCLDCDTEYLTPNGWKKMSDYENERIMIYDEITNTSKFEYPNVYIVNDCDSFIHLNNATVDQMLTHDHRVLLFPGNNKYKNGTRGYVNYLENWIEKNNRLKKGVTQCFKTTFSNFEDGKRVVYSDDELRLIIAISADGCIRTCNRVEFHLSKKRKIERLMDLLNRMGIRYSIHDTKDNTFSCSVWYSQGRKDLSFLFGVCKEQLKVVIDEIQYWDGSVEDDGTIHYYTTIKNNVDVIQYAYAVLGIRTNYSTPTPKENEKQCYHLYTTKNNMVQFPHKNHIEEVKSKDGKSYCFNTNTGYFFIRRNGKIAVTGNCGVCAIPTNLDFNEVKANAKRIHNSIHRGVPTGYNSHKKAVNEIDYGFVTPDLRKMIIEKNAMKQLGTLGGGNHFIEIGVSDENPQRVWIIIHSGSRGIGHACATHYIKIASPTGKASEGHYGFDIASEKGNAYYNDMLWCMSFALFNRTTMLKLIKKEIKYYIPSVEFDWDNLINRTHNHAEVIEGGKYIIHRKGATHAEKDMLGVIPGNMRDGSFIVRGKGYEKALNSSSHGAGRVLGRNVAKKTLKLENFKHDMKGIVADVKNKTLDESPAAYKNIFEVMENQKEMIDIICHVKPIINVKG